MRTLNTRLVLCLCGLVMAVSAAATPCNILVLLADDWRFDTLGVAGDPVVKTPNLDRLAGAGFRFTNARVTTAICGVSRSSILTGQWMSRHGNRSFQTMKSPWTDTYPSVLRRHGYHVGHVGKWHSGPFPAREFDFGRAYSGTHWMKREDGSRVHVTRRNEEDALEFLRTRPKDKPFMLNLWFFAPHAEDANPAQYLPQPESMTLYQDIDIPIPPLANVRALHNLPGFLQQPENEGRIRYHWRFDTPEKFQRMMKNYYRLCTEVDATCGRVIEELKREGELDHTLILFTGDNGYFHGDRELADKWYPYEESMRVPLIVRDPRMPPSSLGGMNDDLVLNVDLAPTILGAAGIKAPGRMQGRDFSPMYLNPGKSPTAPWRTEFYYEHDTITNKKRIPSSQAVVRKDLKYTLWPEWKHEELFDMSQDPQEQENRAGAAEYAVSLAEMRARLEILREQAK